jgi:hypothetical protein
MLDDHVRSGSADGVLHGINNGPCRNAGHTLGSRRPDAPGNRIWFIFVPDRHGTIAASARVRRHPHANPAAMAGVDISADWVMTWPCGAGYPSSAIAAGIVGLGN